MKTLNPTPEQIKTLPFDDLPTNEEWETNQQNELKRLIEEHKQRAKECPELFEGNQGIIEFTFLLKLPPRFLRTLYDSSL